MLLNRVKSSLYLEVSGSVRRDFIIGLNFWYSRWAFTVYGKSVSGVAAVTLKRKFSVRPGLSSGKGHQRGHGLYP